MIDAKICKDIADKIKNDSIGEVLDLIIEESFSGKSEMNLYLSKSESEDLIKRGFDLKFLEQFEDDIDTLYRISWSND